MLEKKNDANDGAAVAAVANGANDGAAVAAVAGGAIVADGGAGAAERRETILRWGLGKMKGDGVGVARKRIQDSFLQSVEMFR